MDAEFRKRAEADFARLLVHYRTIEFWIKRAEQINKLAVIPAINELRYAARQLFNAQRIFAKDPLSDGDRVVIKKRLIVAEQYFYNAEHDIWDAIFSHFDILISDLDTEYGTAAIAVIYPEFPLLKQRRDECFELIADARQYYERRSANYARLRGDLFPYFVQALPLLSQAEISARDVRSQLNTELDRSRLRVRRLERVNLGLGIFGAVVGFLGLIGIPLSVFLWVWAKDDFCEVYGNRPYVGIVCVPTKPVQSK